MTQDANEPPWPIDLRAPAFDDGPALWVLARDTEVLDLNSPYAYALWCRDFAATSVVASIDRPIGFVTGYRRPDEPETLFVWQVAVADVARGQGIAGRMLDALVDRPSGTAASFTHLETTITDDNVASRRLFTSFAERHHAQLDRRPLFESRHFPDEPDVGHEPEVLHRIGPFPTLG
jgi:diaminobutyrate acetyltransferase